MKSAKFNIIAMTILNTSLVFAANPQGAAYFATQVRAADLDDAWAQRWREDRDLLQQYQQPGRANAGKLQHTFESEPKRFRRLAGGGFALTNHWLKKIRDPRASVFADVQIYNIKLEHASYGKSRAMKKRKAEELIRRYSQWLLLHPMHKEAAMAKAEVETLARAIAERQVR